MILSIDAKIHLTKFNIHFIIKQKLLRKIGQQGKLRGQSPGETKAQAYSCPLPMKSHTQCLILSVTMCDDPC